MENINNIKNYSGVPLLSIRKVFEISNVSPHEIDLIAIASFLRVEDPVKQEKNIIHFLAEYLAPYLHEKWFIKISLKFLHLFRKKKELYKLLQTAYVNNILHTHVSQIKPKGRFLIQGEIKERFWDLYCETIQQNIGNVDVGIAEKPQQFLPIIVDVDLKIQDSGEVFCGGKRSAAQ